MDWSRLVSTLTIEEFSSILGAYLFGAIVASFIGTSLSEAFNKFFKKKSDKK